MRQTTTESKAPLPESARGLCWGGFFLNWIWAIGNKTWIGLLCFIPILNFIMPFVLLFKGREWAWKNNHWVSVEEFNKTQRIWSFIGIAFFGLLPVLGIFAAIAIPNFTRYQLRAKQSEAKYSLVAVFAAEKALHAEFETYSSDLDKLLEGQIQNKFYKVGFTNSDPELAKYCQDCFATKDSFKAVAVGYLRKNHEPDVWTIDQEKQLINVLDGIK